MPKKSLILVDGSSYLYRAFHALPDLRNRAGEPTGAIYGIAAMLKRLREDPQLAGGAEFGAVVFDAKGKTFRDDLYAEYKANRAEMPEDLVRQVEPIHALVRALGWPLLCIEGIEADDVIGTLARRASEAGMRVIVITGDKDLAQLVDDDVVLVNTMSRDGGPPERLDRDGVIAKFGVAPERIVDYLTLVGDAVDNVPGVQKVGPKTAVKWLAAYESLDGVIAHADEIKGVVGENLRQSLDWLPTARTLVTVVTDCDLSQQLSSLQDDLRLRERDDDALREQFEHWNFRAWLREVQARADAGPGRAAGDTDDTAGAAGAGGAAAADPAAGAAGATETAAHARPRAHAVPTAPAPEYETVLDEAALSQWIERIANAPLTSVDTETTSLDPMAARIVGISLSVEPGRACYIPLAHRYAGAPDQLDRDAVLARLTPWLEDAGQPKLGQHLKYDQHVFANHGIALAGVAHDTLLQSYVLEAHRSHNMDALAERHLGRRTTTYVEVAGKGSSQIPFEQVPLERAAHYAAEDAEVTMQLHTVLHPQIAAEPGLAYVYRHIELPTAQVLFRMERTGVLVDAAALERQSAELGARMVELERKAYEAAGDSFNLNSPKQIGEIFFQRLKLPVVKKTASGAPSTDEEVLERLAADYPLPRILLDYRALSKLKSTYTDKLPRMVDPATGRVHTNYAQAVAVTGRLASSDPNLQNIPIRTAEGRRIREAFVAPPGHAIVSADYSQIELRIMAHISGDAGLTAAFARGEDVHRATAAEIFGVDAPEVSSEQRRYAKVINFGLIYGMSAFGLASNLGIERDAAKSYIERYFARYPGVAAYMEHTRAQARQRGFVETVFGRRLWLAEINSPNGPRRQAAERAAINAPMQGTAADLIKLAMIAVQAWLDHERMASRLIMQVHDELVLEVPDGELDAVRSELPRLMASVAELAVPLEVELGVGSNWDQAH